MRGFISGIRYFVAWNGMTILLFLPLFVVFGNDGWVAAGAATFSLAYAGIMTLLLGKEDRWKYVGWFRRFLLLLMSALPVISLAYFLFGILIFLLILGVFIGGGLGLSTHSVTGNGKNFNKGVKDGVERAKELGTQDGLLNDTIRGISDIVDKDAMALESRDYKKGFKTGKESYRNK